jgi:thioredoxin-dependent peroxiredoxin
MYGKTYFGNERTTFIVDSDGRVAHVLRKVKPAEHDELALRALERATCASHRDV